MPDIMLELPIAAPPERVYAAITEESALSSWWTPDVDAEPRVGSIAEFRFRGGRFVAKMEITELEPDRGVRWVVTGCAGVGGHVCQLGAGPAADGTRVRFGHHGYPSVEGSFASANFNWAFYLSSLKDYLETGRADRGSSTPSGATPKGRRVASIRFGVGTTLRAQLPPQIRGAVTGSYLR